MACSRLQTVRLGIGEHLETLLHSDTVLRGITRFAIAAPCSKKNAAGESCRSLDAQRTRAHRITGIILFG
jgi:hypothetical protein